MYKLILADDEIEVREGVIREIDWEGLGFEIIGRAENGKEALEVVERTVPDVIVTDIQMPFMNGLQLAEAVRSKYPTVKIIILTGFDEFEYAQKAIKLQIDEYLLKPFSSQELVDVLLKVKEKIVEESVQRENIQVLKEHYAKSIPVLREVFLASLFTRKIPLREIEEKSERYDMNLSGQGYAVSVISMDTPIAAHSEESGKSGGAAGKELKPLSLKDSADQELKTFAIYNIADEIISRHGLGKAIIHNDKVAILTISHEYSLRDVTQTTLTVMEEIRQSIERYLRFTVTVGVSNATTDVTHVRFAFEDALNALDYRVIHGNNRIICIGDVETNTADKLRFDEWKEKSLIRTLKVGTVEELKETVDQLFEGMADGKVSMNDFQIYLLEILTSMMKAVKDANLETDEVFGPDFVLFEEIRQYQHIEAAKTRIVELGARLMNHIASDRQSSYKKLVQDAIEYTKDNYHDPDISIAKVCGQLHISAGYFSGLFKKETKMTFVNYLNQVRMEAAKDLLLTTDLKTFEIAEKVGYADPNYFSFSFKKLVGSSPKEFRSRSGGNP